MHCAVLKCRVRASSKIPIFTPKEQVFLCANYWSVMTKNSMVLFVNWSICDNTIQLWRFFNRFRTKVCFWESFLSSEINLEVPESKAQCSAPRYTPTLEPTAPHILLARPYVRCRSSTHRFCILSMLFPLSRTDIHGCKCGTWESVGLLFHWTAVLCLSWSWCGLFRWHTVSMPDQIPFSLLWTEM